VLWKEPAGILEKPGENSQAERVVRFTNVDQILRLEPVLQDYIVEAVEVEKAGLKLADKNTPEYEVPEELQVILDEDPVSATLSIH
jgi:uncharacterized protein YdeI (YjbR/CyaY-like superfamily)